MKVSPKSIEISSRIVNRGVGERPSTNRLRNLRCLRVRIGLRGLATRSRPPSVSASIGPWRPQFGQYGTVPTPETGDFTSLRLGVRIGRNHHAPRYRLIKQPPCQADTFFLILSKMFCCLGGEGQAEARALLADGVQERVLPSREVVVVGMEHLNGFVHRWRAQQARHDGFIGVLEAPTSSRVGRSGESLAPRWRCS